jgi:hypothetical protein
MRIAELEHHNLQLEKIRKDIITSININPLPDRASASSFKMIPEADLTRTEESEIIRQSSARYLEEQKTPLDNYARSMSQSLQMLQLPLKHIQHNPAMFDVSRNFPLPSERKPKSIDEDPITFQRSEKSLTGSEKSMAVR